MMMSSVGVFCYSNSYSVHDVVHANSWPRELRGELRRRRVLKRHKNKVCNCAFGVFVLLKAI